MLKYLITLSLSVMLPRLNSCNDFNEIGQGNTLIVEVGYKRFFTAITDMHAG